MLNLSNRTCLDFDNYNIIFYGPAKLGDFIHRTESGSSNQKYYRFIAEEDGHIWIPFGEEQGILVTGSFTLIVSEDKLIIETLSGMGLEAEIVSINLLSGEMTFNEMSSYSSEDIKEELGRYIIQADYEYQFKKLHAKISVSQYNAKWERYKSQQKKGVK